MMTQSPPSPLLYTAMTSLATTVGSSKKVAARKRFIFKRRLARDRHEQSCGDVHAQSGTALLAPQQKKQRQGRAGTRASSTMPAVHKAANGEPLLTIAMFPQPLGSK